MYLTAKSGGFRSHGNEDINSYVNSYTNTSEKAEPTASTRFIKRFSNQEYHLTILKSRTQQGEKE